jgi:hypothetical protein
MMRVPKETAMYDDQGNLSRTWILFWQSLAGEQQAFTVNDLNDLVTIDGVPVTY